MNLISIRNITKRYHTKDKEVLSLDNISFDIEDNKILGIIGPSGCGKSTLLNILTGLDKDYSGVINKYHNIKIGYMMQNDANLPWLTNYQNALLGLSLKKELTKERINDVNDLFDKYGLTEFKEMYPYNLSGGMKQRLSLIRTLAIKPNLLLLDEPFSKLDIDSRLKVSDDVYNIIKKRKIATVLITHDISEAITLCDKLIILSKRPGKITNIMDINLKGDIPSHKRKKDSFFKLYNEVWNLLEHES